MSGRADELNVRALRRFLTGCSTAELLGPTCLGPTPARESNARTSRRLLVERSAAELLAWYM